MKIAQFKGYLLEEALAYLIRTSGYSLINSPSSHDPDLEIKGNGLNLRGRGAYHQIDVIAELNWIPAFNYPIRLLVEAKFRDGKTGIDVIRQEVGILSDVNENYFIPTDSTAKARYRYVSAVFSTSGFSEPAVDMAIAHQIQIADLGIEEYNDLKRIINDAAEAIFGDAEEISKEEGKRLRKQFRNSLFGFHNDEETNENILELSRNIKDEYRELFIGMSVGGHMLLLKADNPENFVRYIKEHGSHDIVIHWRDIDNGKRWEIRPAIDRESYTLAFVLPSKLHRYIFEIAENRYTEAINQKEVHFSKITVTYYDKDEDREYIINLKFNKDNFELAQRNENG